MTARKDEQILFIFSSPFIKTIMSKLFKKTITVTAEEYQIVLDALEFMESKISAKLAKTVESKKRRKLTNIKSAIQELLIDLDDDGLDVA